MRVKAQKESWMKMGVMWEASIINKNVNYRELAKKNLCRVYIVVETANNDMLKALCTKATTCKMLNCKINEEEYFFQTLPRQYDVIGKKILSSDSKIEDETKKKCIEKELVVGDFLFILPPRMILFILFSLH